MISRKSMLKVFEPSLQ